MLDRLPWALGALLWSALIYWLSSQPGGNPRLEAIEFPGLDKIAHFFAFGVLAALLAQAFRDVGDVWSLVLAVVLTSAFGVTDELHQRFTPGRDPNVLDWVADTLGAIAFTVAVWFLRR